MQQQENNKSEGWKKGVKEPFQGGREYFASVPKQERSEFIKKLLMIKQLPIQAPFSYTKPFPFESSFNYLGHSLHYYAIQPTPSPTAILILIHGVNSNGNAFGYLANRIAQKNKQINIYAYDQLNFGKSGGDNKGLILSLEERTTQARAFIELILERLETKPKIFLCGHSFGGAISIKLTLLSPTMFSGMILLAPALKEIKQNYYYTKRALKFVGWLFPRYRINKSAPPGLGTKYNCKNKFLNDPLIFTDGIMPGTIRAIMNTTDQIYSSLHKITTPFLCIAAGVQKLLDPFGPLDLEERSPSQDKRVIYCRQMWHVMTEEEQIDGVAWHCAQWLSERA